MQSFMVQSMIKWTNLGNTIDNSAQDSIETLKNIVNCVEVRVQWKLQIQSDTIYKNHLAH